MFTDDDDRAYNASVELNESPGWYPEWSGPDDGAFEEWIAFLRENGETHTTEETRDNVTFQDLMPEGRVLTDTGMTAIFADGREEKIYETAIPDGIFAGAVYEVLESEVKPTDVRSENA